MEEKKKYKILLALVVVVATYVRFFGPSHLLDHGLWADEPYYLEATKNLYLYNAYEYQGEAVLKPPLLVYLSAGVSRIFGFNEALLRILPPIFGTLSVLLMYYLGKEMFNETVGVVTAGFAVFQNMLWIFSIVFHLEVLLIFFFTLAIYLSYKGQKDESVIRLFYAGIAIVLAALSKQQGLLLFPILFVFLIFSSKSKELWYKTGLVLGLPLLSIVPWYFTAEENDELFKSLFYSLTNPSFTLEFVHQLPTIIGIGIIFLSLVGIFGLRSHKRERLLLLLWILIPLMLTPLTRGYDRWSPRYLITIVPPFLLLASFGLETVYIRSRKRYKHLAIFACGLIFSSIFFASAFAGAKTIDKELLVNTGHDEVGEWLVYNTPKDSTIMAYADRQVRFYSDRHSIRFPVDLYYPRNIESVDAYREKIYDMRLKNEVDYLVLDVPEKVPYLRSTNVYTPNRFRELYRYPNGKDTWLVVYKVLDDSRNS